MYSIKNMNRFFSSVVFALLFLGLSYAKAGPDLKALTETFNPITTGSSEGSRWFTLEGTLEVPTNLEEHLLIRYTGMWSEGPPASYEQLKESFNEMDPEERGYPVVNSEGVINSIAAQYWIKKHTGFNKTISSKGIFKRSNVLSIVIDRKKSKLIEKKNLVRIVYRVRMELELKDKTKSFEDYDLRADIPSNLHSQYWHVLETQQSRMPVEEIKALKQKALDALSNNSLPKSRLKWRDVLMGVEHECFGEESVKGAMTMGRFLSNYKPTETKCYLPKGFLAKTTVEPEEKIIQEVTAYPEYHELFEGNKLSILFAIQRCNDKRYPCDEGNLDTDTGIKELLASLVDHGYTAGEKADNVSHFSRKVGELEIDLKVFQQIKPVHYETKFWELYPQSTVVITNRVPMMSEHFNKVYAPRFQMLVAQSVSRFGWGRILPELDYALDNFDGVRVGVNRTPRSQLLGFLESIVQTSKYYKKKLSEWEVDTDWRYLLKGLEKGGDDSYRSGAVAYFVRNNNFDPEKEKQVFAQFNRSPALADYVSLMKAPDEEENEDFDWYSGLRRAYLYLTLHQGATAEDFDTLNAKLTKICEDNFEDDSRDRDYSARYYFFKNCSPRTILASGRTVINGVKFARGSFLDLYSKYNQRIGIPRSAYLADVTEIGDFKFKPYYQDTGGVLKFSRKTGKLLQGHLAENVDYKGLPLLGGKGTCMVRFFDSAEGDSPTGQLQTAQLRENVDFKMGDRILKLRGSTPRGPHRVEFTPKGELYCAYLSVPQEIDEYTIADPDSQFGAEVIESKEERKVCFHANGRLKSGVLAKPFEGDEATYPVGTKIGLSAKGKILYPQYLTVTEGESFFEPQVEFPAGSRYTMNPKTKSPKWILLAGDLQIRNHKLTKGCEVTFGDSKIGSLRVVKVPKESDKPNENNRPYVALEMGGISVPNESTLLLDSYGEPRELLFKNPVTFGKDKKYTFVPDPKTGHGSLYFHYNGRVEGGTLGADITVEDDHYEGAMTLKAGTEVNFSEEGNLESGTLASSFEFYYTILDDDELPDSGTYYEDGDERYLRKLTFPAGTVVSLSHQSKVRNARIPDKWADEDTGIVVEAGGSVRFNDAHEVGEVDFPAAGGQVGKFFVGAGRVEFYEQGKPESVTLAKSAEIGDMSIPAGAMVSFLESGEVAEISAEGVEDVEIQVEDLTFTREIAFFENGKVERGYLKTDVTYNGVKIASLATCRSLRLASPGSRAESCAVTFYEDDEDEKPFFKFLRGMSADTFEKDGKVITAGQPIEFDEDGNLY